MILLAHFFSSFCSFILGLMAVWPQMVFSTLEVYIGKWGIFWKVGNFFCEFIYLLSIYYLSSPNSTFLSGPYTCIKALWVFLLCGLALILNCACRGCWRNNAERKGFASWFGCACVANLRKCVASPAASSCGTRGFLQHQGFARQPAVVSGQLLHLLNYVYSVSTNTPINSFPWDLEARFQQAPEDRLPASSSGTLANSLLSITYGCSLQ